MKINEQIRKAIEGLKSVKGDNKITFEAKDGKMKIFVSSPSCFGVYSTNTDENLSITVNLEHLLRILSVTKEPTMSVKDNMVFFNEEESEMSLPIASSFVNELKGKGTPVTLKFKNEEFTSLASHTTFATAKDDSRPVFTAIGVKVVNGEICAYASNMHTLATIKVVADVNGNLDTIKLLPKDVFSLKPVGDVTMTICDNIVSVSYSGFVFSFPLIDGTAPNYDGVIPSTNVEMELSKEAFLREVNKTLLASVGKEMNPIQVYFRTDKIELYSECNEFGKVRGAVKATIPALLQNKRVAFNGEYLGAIKHFDAETFTLATVVNGDSIEISPIRLQNKEEEFTFVVTPVRLNSWSLDKS